MHFLATPRRILITGASQGIGRATALALAKQAHSLVLAARNAEPLHAVAEQVRRVGGRAQAVAIDVTDNDSVQRGVREVLATGPLEVLVNTAGNCRQREFSGAPRPTCSRR